jgi:hypothetical protein
VGVHVFFLFGSTVKNSFEGAIKRGARELAGKLLMRLSSRSSISGSSTKRLTSTLNDIIYTVFSDSLSSEGNCILTKLSKAFQNMSCEKYFLKNSTLHNCSIKNCQYLIHFSV